MEPIVTDYVNLTEEEFLKFSMHVYRKRIARMKWLGLAGVIVLIAGIATIQQVLAVAGLALGGAGFGDIAFVRGWLRRRYRDPGNKLIKSPTRAIIDENQLVFESQAGTSSTVPWETFVDIEEFEGSYLLYLGKETPAVMLPRAQSKEDWARFSELAATKKSQLSR